MCSAWRQARQSTAPGRQRSRSSYPSLDRSLLCRPSRRLRPVASSPSSRDRKWRYKHRLPPPRSRARSRSRSWPLALTVSTCSSNPVGTVADGSPARHRLRCCRSARSRSPWSHPRVPRPSTFMRTTRPAPKPSRSCRCRSCEPIVLPAWHRRVRRIVTLTARMEASLRRVTLAVVTLLVLLASACSPPAPTPAPVKPPTPTPEPTPGPLGSPDYGVHMFIWGQPSTTQRDLQLAADAGFRWQKSLFQWREIEGGGKGQFDWSESDRVVRA